MMIVLEKEITMTVKTAVEKILNQTPLMARCNPLAENEYTYTECDNCPLLEECNDDLNWIDKFCPGERTEKWAMIDRLNHKEI
jgi:hypothetical protein